MERLDGESGTEVQDEVRPSEEVATELPREPRIRSFTAFARYPDFRLLWVSSLFFFAGVWTQTLVLGWLVYELTGSELQLAIFTAARLGPMLLGPIGGVVADRFDRMRFLLGTVVWELVAVSAVAILVMLGDITYWQIVVAGFMIGLAQAPAQPARFTLVLDIVDRRHLSNANALNTVALNMTQVIGPALGAVMISTLGVATALWVSATWYVISFATLWPIRHVGRRTVLAGRASPFADLLEGIRIVLSHRTMAAVLFISLAANIFLWPVYQAFMPVFAKDILLLDAGGLGLLMTLGGAGALVGSLLIATLGDFAFKGKLYIFGTCAFGVLFALFALSTSVPLSMALMLGIGLASSAFGVMQSTLLLMLAPPGVSGRAMGLQGLAIGILPIATIGHGLAADAIGVSASTTISGIAAATLLIGVALWVPSLRRLG
ncbi:MFS transporter [Kribbella qitaiheensis]|uniref:MFS transporter n=1 Tax=Kribbella qitaiheensis TaxID=1544730 RepID=UPI0036138EF1